MQNRVNKLFDGPSTFYTLLWTMCYSCLCMLVTHMNKSCLMTSLNIFVFSEIKLVFNDEKFSYEMFYVFNVRMSMRFIVTLQRFSVLIGILNWDLIFLCWSLHINSRNNCLKRLHVICSLFLLSLKYLNKFSFRIHILILILNTLHSTASAKFFICQRSQHHWFLMWQISSLKFPTSFVDSQNNT